MTIRVCLACGVHNEDDLRALASQNQQLSYPYPWLCDLCKTAVLHARTLLEAENAEVAKAREMMDKVRWKYLESMDRPARRTDGLAIEPIDRPAEDMDYVAARKMLQEALDGRAFAPEKCRSCLGKGSFQLPNSTVPCYRCNGKGYEPTEELTEASKPDSDEPAIVPAPDEP